MYPPPVVGQPLDSAASERPTLGMNTNIHVRLNAASVCVRPRSIKIAESTAARWRSCAVTCVGDWYQSVLRGPPDRSAGFRALAKIAGSFRAINNYRYRGGEIYAGSRLGFSGDDDAVF